MWSLALGWDAALFSNSACLSLLSVVSWCGTRTLSKYCETFICNGNYQLWYRYFLPEHSQQHCISYYHQNWKCDFAWLSKQPTLYFWRWSCHLKYSLVTMEMMIRLTQASGSGGVGDDVWSKSTSATDRVATSHHGNATTLLPLPPHCSSATTDFSIETQSYNSLHSTILLHKTGIYVEFAQQIPRSEYEQR